MAYLEQSKRDVEDLIPGEAIKVSFSQRVEDQKLLRKLVRDSMYSDTYAFVREIASNSYDACIENKSDRIPQIILQKANIEDVDNKVIFRDFGKGMSKDFMINSFNQLGESSKRNDNTQIGSRGLGRVSPLKYTDSFYIITRSEGKECTWFIYLDSEDEIAIKFIFEKETEETGTDVVITVKNVNELITHLQDKLRYFKIERIGWENKKLPDVLFENELGIVYDRSNYSNPYGVALGGLYYPYNVYINNRFSCVLHFDIGELTLPATREYLENTKSNNKKIEEKRQLLEIEANKFFEKDVLLEKDVISKYCKANSYAMSGYNYPLSREVKFFKIRNDDVREHNSVFDFAKSKVQMVGKTLELARVRTYFLENPDESSLCYMRIDDDEYKKLNLNYLKAENYKKTVYKKEATVTEIWGSLNGYSNQWVKLNPTEVYVYSLLDERDELNQLRKLLSVTNSKLPHFQSISLGKSRLDKLPKNCINYKDYITKNFDEIKRLYSITKFERNKNSLFNRYSELKKIKLKGFKEIYNKAKNYLKYDGTYTPIQWFDNIEDTQVDTLINELTELRTKYLLFEYFDAPKTMEYLEDELIKIIENGN